MSIYVLDIERFDKSRPPTNVRHERAVVLGSVDDIPRIEAVFTATGRQSLEDWLPAERYALYEVMRKAELLYAAHGPMDKPGSAPGRVL